MKPSSLRRLHAALTVVWVLLAVPCILVWRDSVPFLVGVSIYARAARAEDATGAPNGQEPVG